MTDDPDLPPPNDIEAEREVLDAMIGGLDVPQLTTADFYLPHHQVIHSHLSLMAGQPIKDRLGTLRALLADRSPHVLDSLTDVLYTPANYQRPLPVERVREFARRRRLIERMQKIIAALRCDHVTADQAVRAMAKGEGV